MNSAMEYIGIKRISRRAALTVLLLFSAVANSLFESVALHSSFFILHSSFIHAQGLPLIRNYTAVEYRGHNRCYDIEIGEDGTVFVANFEGLLYYDRSRWRIIDTPEMNRVTVVYRANDNTVWVGGYNYFARLQRKDNGELMMQRIGEQNLFKGEVMEIFEIDGSLQFLVSDNYIYEVKGISDSDMPTVTRKKRANTDLHMGISSDIISVEKLTANENDVVLDDITQTEELDGGLRVKVRMNNGLMITDANDHELYTITEADGLCSNQVAYVAYDGHGMLWGATSHGVFAIEMPSAYSYILGKDGLTGEVYTITAFDGDVYVGGTNGLYYISSRQCRRIEAVTNICWALCHQGDYMLAATSSGTYRIGRGRSVSRLTPNATTALLVEGDKVYAGEADAVWLYQGDFTRRTKVADMPLVTAIRSDGHGRLWLQNVYGETSGNDPGKLREPLEELPEHLLKPLSDIEVKTQFRYGEQYWIGGDEVVAVIDTGKQQLAKLTEGSLVRFTSIVLGNDSVLWGGYGEMPEQLKKIDSDNRHLHFYYALSYAQLSGKTLYRYRLNTDNWSAWTEKQDIEFLNMPYGSYTLSVQAQQASGELSEIATVSFSIAYPLLMRWYMVAVYFMLAGYLVWLLFRYRLKRLQKDKIKLERIVEQRTSEVVKQKDEIVRQKDEIEEKSKSLEKALDDLSSAQHELIRQEKMATVGKLTEGLIDRILNPMNFIINFSKMSSDLLSDIKTNIDSNKERINADDYDDTLDMLGMLTENLQHVEQNGQSTTHMLKAMREILKDRTGGYVDMDLLPVLQRNEEMFNNSFAKEKEQHHISFSVRLPAEAMPLHGNPDMLSKTVMSLLGNAVHAIVKKAQHISYAPEVSLTATATGHHYTLRIRDNGIGIEEKILPKIFDPFFTTKTTQEAAGVGLYLSREIIQNHGGDITVESALDQYTEFTVTLPKLKR